MNSFHLFDFLPIWVIFLGLLVFILISTWMGVAFVRSRKDSNKGTELGHLNAVVGAILGLVAFILAFSFSLVISRFDARKEYLLQEVNAIETTWFRTGLISEPQCSNVKELLLEFVRLRIESAKQPEKLQEIIDQSNLIQQKIWHHVTELSKNEQRNDAFNALFVEAVNEMFDNQTKRVTVTLTYRIPTLIWVLFFFLLMIAMFAVGYLFGKKKQIDWNVILALALAFSAVVCVIIDLDSSSTGGLIRINYEPIFDLYERLLNG